MAEPTPQSPLPQVNVPAAPTVQVKLPKQPKTWAKTKGIMQSGVILSPLVGLATFIYSNSDYVDWSIVIHAQRNHNQVVDAPTTADLARATLPQYMQPAPAAPEPGTADVMRAAANELPPASRARVLGAFQQALTKIRQTRIRNAGQLSKFLLDNVNDPQADNFMQVWNNLAKENARAGNFQNMGDVSQFCTGTTQVLQGQ